MGRKNFISDDSETAEDMQLSPVQQKAITSLMLGKTYLEAAADAGVTDRTIRRWRENSPAFELALRTQIQSVKESASISACVAVQTAVKTLAEIVATPSHPQVIPAIRLILGLSGPLQPIKAPTSVNDVQDEQSIGMLQRFSTRGFP